MAAHDRQAHPGQALVTLEEACVQVASLLVQSFGFSEVEARHRVALWRARQHNLEGEALEAQLRALPPDERAQRLLQWALQGAELEGVLRRGAAELGLDLAE